MSTDVPPLDPEQPPVPDPVHEPAEAKRGRRRISRIQVVNRIIDLYEAPRYLEIGVCEAATFRHIRAAHKVAVDPLFRFDVPALQQAQPHAECHEVTSDAYFADIVAPEEKFDVIYLDGLHTFEQTLRDLMNALDHLQPRGTIVIDDTHPPHFLASMRDRKSYFAVRRRLQMDSDQRWMGDVFRVVWFIDTFCPHLSYGTVTNNHGQTIVWRSRRNDHAVGAGRTVAEVAAATFEDVALNPDVLRLEPYRRIRQRLRADLGL